MSFKVEGCGAWEHVPCLQAMRRDLSSAAMVAAMDEEEESRGMDESLVVGGQSRAPFLSLELESAPTGLSDVTLSSDHGIFLFPTRPTDSSLSLSLSRSLSLFPCVLSPLRQNILANKVHQHRTGPGCNHRILMDSCYRGISITSLVWCDSPASSSRHHTRG